MTDWVENHETYLKPFTEPNFPVQRSYVKATKSGLSNRFAN